MQDNKVIHILPKKIREEVQREIPNLKHLQEIRLRVGKPLILLYRGEEVIPGDGGKIHIITREEVDELLEYISNYSLYAFEETNY